MCAKILGAVWIEELKNAPVRGGGRKKFGLGPAYHSVACNQQYGLEYLR
jgi:hypothetical protein